MQGHYSARPDLPLWRYDHVACGERWESIKSYARAHPSLVCFAVQPGQQIHKYVFGEFTSPPQPYLDAALKYLSDVSQEISIKVREFIFILWVMEDNSTMERALMEQLQKAGFLIFAHSVHSAVQSLVTLVPNFHFIETAGFKQIVSRVRAARSKLTSRDRCVFWRGSTTGLPCAYGIWSNCTDRCAELPRVKAVQASLNSSWLDFRLTSLTQVCASAYWLRDQNLMSSPVPEESWMRCQGLLEMEGNVDAWGAHWRQMSDSVIFMVKPNFVTLHSARLQAGVHYIEISRDLSDLLSKTKIITSVEHQDIQLLRQVKLNAAAAAAKFTYSNAVKETSSRVLNHMGIYE